MSYFRIIPRDLFNESKLLKCLGQLSLIIHDGVGVPAALTLNHTAEEEGFYINQDQSSGALYCANLELSYFEREIGLSIPYNSKDAYPLSYSIDNEAGRVLTDDGKLSSDFMGTLKALQRAE